MKKQNILTGSIIMALAGGALAEPAVTDYQEAPSSYQDAYVSGQFNLDNGNQDQGVDLGSPSAQKWFLRYSNRSETARRIRPELLVRITWSIPSHV